MRAVESLVQMVADEGFVFLFELLSAPHPLYRSSHEPLHARKACTSSHLFQGSSSFTVAYAATILQPDFLTVGAGLSRQECREFSIWICSEFFKRTAQLLTKAKKEWKVKKEDRESNMDLWSILKEHLMTIWILTEYEKLRLRVLKDYVIKRHDNGRTKSTKRGDRMEDINNVSAGHFDLSTSKENDVINPESWDHLGRYTTHWLCKLGEVPGCYVEMMRRTRSSSLGKTRPAERILKLSCSGVQFAVMLIQIY